LCPGSISKGPMTRFTVRSELCTGCMNCQTVCSLLHGGSMDRSRSTIRVMLDIFSGRHSHVYCRQCPSPECAGACPAGAIRRVPSTGAWVIDADSCTMCGLCVKACPFGAVFLPGDGGPPLKCDLCGGHPACLEACGFDAIISAEEPE
jgi:Fe-S-cluster-containing hydrogenase component 2